MKLLILFIALALPVPICYPDACTGVPPANPCPTSPSINFNYIPMV